MKRNAWLIGIAVLATVALASASYAGGNYGHMGPGAGYGMMGPGNGPGMGFGMMGPGMGRFWDDADVVAELSLTTDQIATLDQLDDTYNDQFRTHWREMRSAQQALDDAFTSGDADQIRTAAATVSKLHTQQFNKMIEQRIAVRGVLTDDQATKLQDLQPDRGDVRGRHMGQGRGYRGR